MSLHFSNVSLYFLLIFLSVGVPLSRVPPPKILWFRFLSFIQSFRLSLTFIYYTFYLLTFLRHVFSPVSDSSVSPVPVSLSFSASFSHVCICNSSV
jgi:hypothetical protein